MLWQEYFQLGFEGHGVGFAEVVWSVRRIHGKLPQKLLVQ